MYKTILLSLLSTIFIGCSSTNALKYFKKDQTEARAIQYTKKSDIIYKNEQKVLFWATYLNNIKSDQKKYNKETFIVSLYFTDSKSQDLIENNYKLTLNSKNFTNIKEIDKDDKMYQQYTSKNNWGKQYLVEFDKIKDTYDLKLKLDNPKTNSTELSFEK